MSRHLVILRAEFAQHAKAIADILNDMARKQNITPAEFEARAITPEDGGVLEINCVPALSEGLESLPYAQAVIKNMKVSLR